ncbi:winged helix-turn-helix domain-containing protein [Picrophilus oshimae]|uniref:Regulatory protein, arsR family n=1 Tax=Picrophilus torridus (strain ATCC 700027 / DSM 9790 / JCM 10055 / NBRC 100828 / KAW 2/3) TaxID=1122961 RepID=A0A8G2FW02_PICTO|nr:winged helix-turn-helix domain-containing protein [Picrophilus oshimae]SMD30515.1 regulatory protein, arsR family [Picrophilus oshimae DSM 9789]
MFKITITSVPSRYDDDPDRIIAYFLSDIGYIPRFNPEHDINSIKSSAYFKLFKCFLITDRYWGVDELTSYLKTSRTTLYRHLNKLKSMDIIEELNDGREKKYRLRSGNIESAWSWVEVNVKMALDNYRKTVENIRRSMDHS